MTTTTQIETAVLNRRLAELHDESQMASIDKRRYSYRTMRNILRHYWTRVYECPACKSICERNQNAMSRRTMFCNGVKHYSKQSSAQGG